MYIVCYDIYGQHTTNTQENNGRPFLRCSKKSKKRSKLDSFAAHNKQQFKYDTSCTNIPILKVSKVVICINIIGEMKILRNIYCNICFDEFLPTFKKTVDKLVTIMNKNLGI